MTKPIIDVNAVMFDAVRTFVDAKWRVALTGVYVHPHPKGGALMVATDGHRMVIVHDADGRCTRAATIVPDKDFSRALTSIKGDQRLTVSTEGVASIAGVYLGAGPSFVTGGFEFPEYRRLIANLLDLLKAPARGAASFNSLYLSETAKVGRRLTGDKGTPTRIVTFGPSDMALILWPACPHAFGFIMPMRSDNAEGVPAFFKQVMAGYQPAQEIAA